MKAPIVHICAVPEPILPDPTYLAHIDELLDLRVPHLLAYGGVVAVQAGKWCLHRMAADEAATGDYPMPAGSYTGLFQGEPDPDTVWMSDIPREVWTMWDGIEALRDPDCKRVLITGLGLGVMVQHALRQPHITRIDVVELSEEVMRLVRPHYRDDRLHVHHGDALSIDLGKRRTWDYGYHDFWKATTAANLPDMREVMARYAGRVGRQHCWRQADCLRLMRKESARFPGLRGDWIDQIEAEFVAWAGQVPA